MLRRPHALIILLSLVTACSSSSSPDEPVVGEKGSDHPASDAGSSSPVVETTCNPLAALPTKLATILGVGKDASGALYVADQDAFSTEPSIVRVFIATGGPLVRQDVIGSAGSGSASGEDIETFQSADGSSGPRDLAVTLTNGKVMSMTLGPEGSAKSGVEGIDGGAVTQLTLVSASTVHGLSAVDLPGAVQYVADAITGEAIVVTAPLEDDLGSASFRLFYGTPGAMVERPITSFSQSLSGYPSIGFAVGSTTYTMAIASVPTDAGLGEAPGPVTLTTGNGTTAFILRLPTPTTLGGFTFTCLRT